MSTSYIFRSRFKFSFSIIRGKRDDKLGLNLIVIFNKIQDIFTNNLINHPLIF